MRSFKRTKGDFVFDSINYMLMLGIIVVTLYPFYYVLVASFAPISQIISGKVLLWPASVSLQAYRTVLNNPLIPRSYYNTIFITCFGTLFSMTLTVIGAYVLSKKYLPGRPQLTFMVVFTMLFNGGLIPTFLTVKALGFGNTLWVLIIPSGLSAFYLVVMRNFFAELPSSLEESASIDGASQLTILLRIYLPLSLPVLATFFLFYAVGYWNAFFNAIIYLSDYHYWPVPVVLREALVMGRTDNMFIRDDEFGAPLENVKMALIIIAVFPILCVYPFLQKYFVKGLLVGALKG